MKKYPSKDRLRELFDYDPEGYFVWKRDPDKKDPHLLGLAGKKAGCTYVSEEMQARHLVGVDGEVYNEARLVWIYHKGGIGRGMNIFHVDGNISNNRIENLYKTRDKKPKNSRYQRFSRTGSGYIGVYIRGDKFRAKIGKINIGTFSCKEAAAAAYNDKAKELYGDNATLNNVAEIDFNKFRSTREISTSKRHKSKSRYIGVKEHHGSFIAFNVGTFKTEEAAAHAYNLYYLKKYPGAKKPNPVKSVNLDDFISKRKQGGLARPKSKSGYKGVSERVNKKGSTYPAWIVVDGIKKSLGSFDDVQEAARAYNIAAVRYYGKDAKLNDIPNPLGELF